MSAEASATKSGVVRGTLQYATGFAWGLYSRAEQISLVRSTLNLAQPLVPIVQPAVNRAVALADPWVDSADIVVSRTWETVNSNVVTPTWQTVNSNVVQPATRTWQTVNTRVVEPAAIELKNRYAALLDLSDHAVDVLLPETDKDGKIEKKENEAARTKTLVDIRSKTQRRVLKRIETQWKDVRAFSAGRLKEIIHVDLIEYAENGYSLSVSLVQKNVVPVINGLTASAQSTYVTIRTTSAEKSKLLWDAIARAREVSYQRYNAAYKFAADKAEQIGVPVIVGKAKEVSLGEVSDFVLVKLNIKHQDEQYVVAERKIFDLIRTLVGLIIAKDANSKPQSAPANKPAAAAH